MTLRMWTVYDHPKDFPDHFVARLWEVDRRGPRPTQSIIQSNDLEVIRTVLLAEMGLTRMDRQPEDDPKIVEVWL